MKKNRKLSTTGLALAMAAVLVLTGTLAWQSISQTAKNEALGIVNPGGRLHDDFNGSNKDIYVENFTKNGTAIYARVRLDEYMEIGIDAGDTTKEASEKIAQPVVDKQTAKLNDVKTWRTRTPELDQSTDDELVKYWSWAKGGETVYMPTFNMNKDSKASEINGTYEGTKDGDAVHYDDYKTYKVDDKVTGNEIIDIDLNDVDELAGGKAEDKAIEDKNIQVNKDVEHIATKTAKAEVISMSDWKTQKQGKPGDFWVWDEDGWFYYANPICSQEATGLLLDEIKLKSMVNDNWYYGINVVAQFVTADDIGNEIQDKKTGFYAVDDEKPSTDAEALLKVVTAPVDKITVTADKDATSVAAGGTLQMKAEGFKHEHPVSGVTYKWNVARSDTPMNLDTVVDQKTGLLTVSSTEAEGTITVTASYYTEDDPVNAVVVGSMDLTVTAAEP